ncbi:hypothetical protein ACOBQB_26960 [Streptomyces sp. G5(2025)]|uniref:hypothetical protein n=1 Tax=Streptomyces sp. G5(2025) TaxID=3406628 RepID=UPI003C2A29EC
MRVLTCVMDTVQGSRHNSARLVSIWSSSSRVHASWEAAVSRAGEMVRRIVATQLFASTAEYASKDPSIVGGRRPSSRCIQHPPQNPGLVVVLSTAALLGLRR